MGVGWELVLQQRASPMNTWKGSLGRAEGAWREGVQLGQQSMVLATEPVARGRFSARRLIELPQDLEWRWRESTHPLSTKVVHLDFRL